MIREVTLENIGEMSDGAVAAQFQRHLTRAISDCEDRPGDKTARKLVLEVEVIPVMEQMDGGGLPSIVNANITCKIKSKLPDHVSRPTECQIKQGHRAVFNDMSENNINQRTLDEINDDAA